MLLDLLCSASNAAETKKYITVCVWWVICSAIPGSVFISKWFHKADCSESCYAYKFLYADVKILVLCNNYIIMTRIFICDVFILCLGENKSALLATLTLWFFLSNLPFGYWLRNLLQYSALLHGALCKVGLKKKRA